jgi:DNA polymerase I-like protein with 3'-5' exonuclease and polymerase domains
VFIEKYGGISGLDGRWCDLSQLVESGDKWDFERAWRRALNFPMQNGGAAIISSAMVGVVKSKFISKNTDPKAVSTELLRIMVNSFPLEVPLAAVAHIGENYDACK